MHRASLIDRPALGVAVLAAAAASVDACLLLSSGVLTAAQTGNSVLFAVALARGDMATGLGAAISILAFALGVLGGARHLARSASSMAPIHVLSIEAAILLLAAALASQGQALAPIAAAALAMGMQSAVMRRVAAGTSTTYITGLLAGSLATLVESRTVSGASATAPRVGLWIWLVYVLAAIGAAVASLRFGASALLAAPALLALGTACLYTGRH